MRIFKVAMAAAAVVLVAAPALAHDFWIQPARFWLGVNQPTPVSLWVGHGINRGLWDTDIRRLLSLRSYGPGGVTERRGQITQGGQGRISFARPGTHVVALETSHAHSDLPSLRFNDYLEVEGLTPAQRWREANGKTGDAGKEIYSRRAKALVRVGTQAQADAAATAVTRPVGLTLEIVPERNPYTTRAGQLVPFRVYYDGRPQPGVLVKLTNLANDEEPAAMARTNSNGRVAFNFQRRGNWQVNAIWTRRIEGNPTADFDTTFSSLTFGYDPAPAG